MKYITPLNTKRQKTINNKPSLTKQEFKDDCDPTKILLKYQQTGLLEHAKQYEPVYGTQTSLTYLEAKSKTAQAETMFNDLPSSLRKLFDHNVGAFLDWSSDPENVMDMADDGTISLTNQAEIRLAIKTLAAEADKKPETTPEITPKEE